MKRAAAGLIAASLLLAGCGDADAGSTTLPLGPEPAATVVQVVGEVCRRDAQGSGVVIGRDLVLTSAHTVAGSEGGLSVRRPESGSVAASLVGFDPRRDLALLRAEGIDAEIAILGTARPQGSGVIGTVNADGVLELLGYTTDRLITANSGDIYDEGEVARAAMQLSASTLPGDSGGAVFDSNNRVVGIVFAQSRGDTPVAYAVTTEEVDAFLAEVDRSTEVSAGRCR